MINVTRISRFIVTVLFYVSAITTNVICGVPIKVILFALLSLSVVLQSMIGRIAVSKNSLKSYICLLFLISVWGTIGAVNGYSDYVLLHASKIAVFVITYNVLMMLYKNNIFNADDAYGAIKTMLWIGLLFKIWLEAMYVVGVWDREDILAFMDGVLSVTTMTLSIGDGMLMRIGVITDLLLFCVFPFVYEFMSKKEKIILVVCVIFCALVSFSRVYFLQVAVFAIVLACGKKKSFFFSFSLLVIAFLGVVSAMPEGILNSLEARFIGGTAESSDWGRLVQVDAFIKEIPEALFLGRGLGAYIPYLVGSGSYVAPFNYEVEILAIVYQFGIIGISIIALMFFYMLKEIKTKGLPMDFKLIILLNLIFLIVRSFTNTLIFSATTSVVLACCAIFPYIYENKLRVKGEKCGKVRDYYCHT